ncbi:MAG: hypothetical protein U0599_03850 [Vicinamibacteria bacterium]
MHLPLETGIVATVARKFLVVLSHGLFLATGTLLAWPLLELGFARRDRPRRPPVGLLATAVVLASSSAALAATMIGRGPRRRTASTPRCSASAAAGSAAGSERNARRFRRTDDSLVAFFSRPFDAFAASLAPTSRAGSSARSRRCSSAARGRRPPLSAAMVVETALILVRAAAVPVPAGLGIQDAAMSCASRPSAFRTPPRSEPRSCCFARGRDLFWVAAGFLLSRRRPAAGGAGRARGGCPVAGLVGFTGVSMVTAQRRAAAPAGRRG